MLITDIFKIKEEKDGHLIDEYLPDLANLLEYYNDKSDIGPEISYSKAKELISVLDACEDNLEIISLRSLLTYKIHSEENEKSLLFLAAVQDNTVDDLMNNASKETLEITSAGLSDLELSNSLDMIESINEELGKRKQKEKVKNR